MLGGATTNNIIAIAGLLEANHRGTEDCRASQSDPTDGDAPGNPARKPATANSSNNNNTVGGPYHPPLWHCHGRGRRRASTAGIAKAGLLQANHWGTEDCRASQGDPTDSDAPGNPTRKPDAGGERHGHSSNSRSNKSNSNNNKCVGGPDHPPLWRRHGRGRRQPPQ